MILYLVRLPADQDRPHQLGIEVKLARTDAVPPSALTYPSRPPIISPTARPRMEIVGETALIAMQVSQESATTASIRASPPPLLPLRAGMSSCLLFVKGGVLGLRVDGLTDTPSPAVLTSPVHRGSCTLDDESTGSATKQLHSRQTPR